MILNIYKSKYINTKTFNSVYAYINLKIEILENASFKEYVYKVWSERIYSKAFKLVELGTWPNNPADGGEIADQCYLQR